MLLRRDPLNRDIPVNRHLVTLPTLLSIRIRVILLQLRGSGERFPALSGPGSYDLIRSRQSLLV